MATRKRDPSRVEYNDNKSARTEKGSVEENSAQSELRHLGSAGPEKGLPRTPSHR